MKLTQEELSGLSMPERAILAMKEAVRDVIAEHKRSGLPIAVWRKGQAVWISAEEAEAEIVACEQLTEPSN